MSIIETPLPTNLVISTAPPQVLSSGTGSFRTLHLTGRQSVDVFSKGKKTVSIFQIQVTFRMKPVDGSSITICAPSVHEYPSFLVRSISGRTIVLIASVKSIITPPKVGTNLLPHSRS